MHIQAVIKGIQYDPFSGKTLNEYGIEDLEEAFQTDASFLLRFSDRTQLAVSYWVSPKRTRSYPFARVYDTYGFQGKKITVIPVYKDEGFDGDRDFLQWDTVSLMSLLGVYVILGFYVHAEKSPDYAHKITHQRFDMDFIREQLKNVLAYRSDALHWNLAQTENLADIGRRACEAYRSISEKTGVRMHSFESVERRISLFLAGRETFISFSRRMAQKAQDRESRTSQPKENLQGKKAKITIRNYLGGAYYFTCDEVEVLDNRLLLIEGKHSRDGHLPSLSDIKDGLLKMILYTNLEEVYLEGLQYVPQPVLKLTTGQPLRHTPQTAQTLNDLLREAQANGFWVMLNETLLTER
ncbi:MAG: hypothetical protein WHS45_12645 [Anaerolinea sp.]